MTTYTKTDLQLRSL